MRTSEIPLENELKVRVPDHEVVRMRLLELGAIYVGRMEITDILFTRDDFEERGISLLRVRETKYENGKRESLVTLKLKGTISVEGFRVKPEIETGVDDGLIIKQMWGFLGFAPDITLKKTRDQYKYGSVVSLDEYPFGNYVEIEGEPENIRVVRNQLGLREFPPETRGYGRIAKEWNASRIV